MDTLTGITWNITNVSFRNSIPVGENSTETRFYGSKLSNN